MTRVYINNYVNTSTVMEKKINSTEIGIIRSLTENERSVTQLAQELDRSLSWISECVGHLRALGLVETQKRGLTVWVMRGSSRAAMDLSLVMIESPNLNIEAIFEDSGLVVLPLLLKPGATPVEVNRKTGISLRTIRKMIKKWRGMGVVLRGGSRGVYLVNPVHGHLISFLESHISRLNLAYLAETVPNGLIVWQGRDEFIFSVDFGSGPDGFFKAGPSRLDELGCDILSSRDYFYHDAAPAEICKEEALVQTYLLEKTNPRVVRLIREDHLDLDVFIKYTEKYELREELSWVVDEHA